MIIRAGEMLPVLLLQVELAGQKIDNCFLIDTEKEELHCYKKLPDGSIFVDEYMDTVTEIIKAPKEKLHVYVVKPKESSW